MTLASIDENSFAYSLTNDSLRHNELMHKCTHNQSGFQVIEITYECFAFKMNDLKFVFLTVIFVTLIAVDIIANTIVIVSIFMEKNKKRVDICFMSNAMADLMMGTVIMPLTALYTLFGQFPYGNYVCFLWNCLDFTAGTVSMLHIAFISYDRFLSVSKPLKYTQKKSDSFSVTGLPTSLILAFIWFFAAAAWIPAILFIRSSNPESSTTFLNELQLLSQNNFSVGPYSDTYDLPVQNKALFECNIEGPPLLIIPHSLVVYFLPIIIIFVFYSKTILIVNRKMGGRRRSSVSALSALKFTPGRLSAVRSSPNFENSSYLRTENAQSNTFQDNSSMDNTSDKPLEMNECIQPPR